MKKFRIQNKVASVVFSAVFAAGIFGCQNDLLEPNPMTQISDTQIFNSPDRVGLLVNGMYTLVKSGQLLGGRAFVYGDIRANDFLNRTTNGVTGYLVWQHTLTEASQNDVINMWNAAYTAINDINLFIEGIQANTDKYVVPTFPATFAATTVPQYIAEARFLRAVTYHYLLQFYARPYTENAGASPGVPLRLKGQTTSEDQLLARATVAQVYAQIIDDLNFAETNLPLTYANATLRTTRAHRNAAIAFKTRVYLTMGNYASVITEANKIVPTAAPFVAATGVAHALQANIKDTFTAPQETTETIFGMPFTAQNAAGTQNPLGHYYRVNSNLAAAFPPGGGEYSLNNAAGSIHASTALWPTTDARRQQFVYQILTEYFIGNKYPAATPFTDKAQVMRYSEVLLNLSEALARVNGGVDARSLALLNAVRVRAAGQFDHDADPNTATIADPKPWTPADNATLIDNILTERRIEFLGEGLRNQDILRLNGTFPGKGSVPAVAPASAAYLWPIPITERAVNTLVEPN